MSASLHDTFTPQSVDVKIKENCKYSIKFFWGRRGAFSKKISEEGSKNLLPHVMKTRH